MSKKMFFFILVVVLLIAFIFIAQPKDQSSSVPKTDTVSLVIKADKLVSGQTVISVNQKDKVIINFTSDSSGTFQLHGYNKVWKYKKNKPNSFIFTASMSGRFPYELQNTDSQIGVLQVYPK